MHVVAINGSLHGEKGNTARVLGPFLEGLEAAHAHVELFYTHPLRIKPCSGCEHCWIVQPGECIHQDALTELLPKLRAADIWVLATPVYIGGVSAELKTWLERMLMPLVDPCLHVHQDHTAHQAWPGHRDTKIVLVSSAALYELDNFAPVVAQMELIARLGHWDYVGALLRPQAPLLPLLPASKTQGITDAAREAGRQLALTGKLEPETLRQVSGDLLPRDEFLRLYNQRFQLALEKSLAGPTSPVEQNTWLEVDL